MCVCGRPFPPMDGSGKEKPAPGLLPSVGYDCATAEWHLKGLGVCMLAAYFDRGANTSGPKAGKFMAIASYVLLFCYSGSPDPTCP